MHLCVQTAEMAFVTQDALTGVPRTNMYLPSVLKDYAKTFITTVFGFSANSEDS